jgi:hypothetical protein
MTLPRILGTVAYMIAFYLAITAFFGYRLGLEVRAAQSNPYVGIASRILGTQAMESDIIQKSGLPILITASPAFLLALRLTE